MLLGIVTEVVVIPVICPCPSLLAEVTTLIFPPNPGVNAVPVAAAVVRAP